VDADLIGRAQQGDEEAFASLAVAMGDRLHRVAHRILRDMDLAEDATQQALLAIWRDLPRLRDPARFEAWSYRLLVRMNVQIRLSLNDPGCIAAPVLPPRINPSREVKSNPFLGDGLLWQWPQRCSRIGRTCVS
jgi:hypothetical protein